MSAKEETQQLLEEKNCRKLERCGKFRPKIILLQDQIAVIRETQHQLLDEKTLQECESVLASQFERIVIITIYINILILLLL